MSRVTVSLKLRERAPLTVPSEILTANSSVFSYLVKDLSQTELEFDDFNPDIVVTFVSSLENEIMTEICPDDFRELNKLCMTFEVMWLKKHCQDWLTNRIDEMDYETVHEKKLYVFEESRYIMNKWRLKYFIHLFTTKFLSMGETNFISQYLSELQNVDKQQMELMLKLGGSKAELFLKIILRNIEGKNSLHKNTKYLLQRMNLPFCFEQNERLYLQMLEELSQLPELKSADQKFLLQLSVDTGKQVYKRKTTPSITDTVFNFNGWKSLLNICKSLDDLLVLVIEKHVTNMFSMIELLMIVTAREMTDTESSKDFVKKLESCCASNSVIKVLPDYIDMIISALKLTDNENKVAVTELLELIKESEVVTSYYESFCISLKTSEKTDDNNSPGTGWKYPFQFKHPAVTNCSLEGKCGFIIKDRTLEEQEYILELTREEADYEGSGIHYHQEIRADDIFLYVMGSAITHDGSRVRVPARWRRWWFPEVSEGKVEEYCVVVSVRDYLVAR